MAIEERFDIAFVGNLARREKQIQQNYRPVIGVHKWFARRPGTLFRALLLSEFAEEKTLTSSFFEPHRFKGKIVADPFMGGGTPLLEANRVGCHVIGRDVNPMAYWIVRQELVDLDRSAFISSAESLIAQAEIELGRFYKTKCPKCENPSADVKYFLWVKQATCPDCGQDSDLFPGYLVATNDRHSHFVVVCRACGILNELEDLPAESIPKRCQRCGEDLRLEGNAKRRSSVCAGCKAPISYPQPELGPPKHRMFAIEYHCDNCRHRHLGRYFKSPDPDDLQLYAETSERSSLDSLDFVPEDEIPPGDETTRLLKWGYTHYRSLFNARQLLGLNVLAKQIANLPPGEVRFALATVFSDILRYQNMLVRYDTWALKALDIFSIHGYPVGLVQCESSLLGIPGIGSGGFRHFVKKYERAKAYCEKPFEIEHGQSKRHLVYITGERIHATLTKGPTFTDRFPCAWLNAEDGGAANLDPESLDAVLTDPPYFANVQYAELMDFCYIWVRKLLRREVPQFRPVLTRSPDELTGNDTLGRTLEDFTHGLSRIFRRYARALKPNGPFVFTYHHNQIDAYLPLIVAVLDARLWCSAALPCPAEMTASIHISGTTSSTIDTVFVCRKLSVASTRKGGDLTELLGITKSNLEALCKGGLKPTRGDARCVLLGHATRYAINTGYLRWNPADTIERRLNSARELLSEVLPSKVLEHLVEESMTALRKESKDQLALRIRDDSAQEPLDVAATLRSTL